MILASTIEAIKILSKTRDRVEVRSFEKLSRFQAVQMTFKPSSPVNNALIEEMQYKSGWISIALHGCSDEMFGMFG
jgi:hypothetical protein